MHNDEGLGEFDMLNVCGTEGNRENLTKYCKWMTAQTSKKENIA